MITFEEIVKNLRESENDINVLAEKLVNYLVDQTEVRIIAIDFDGTLTTKHLGVVSTDFLIQNAHILVSPSAEALFQAVSKSNQINHNRKISFVCVSFTDPQFTKTNRTQHDKKSPLVAGTQLIKLLLAQSKSQIRFDKIYAFYPILYCRKCSPPNGDSNVIVNLMEYIKKSNHGEIRFDFNETKNWLCEWNDNGKDIHLNMAVKDFGLEKPSNILLIDDDMHNVTLATRKGYLSLCANTKGAYGLNFALIKAL